MDPTKGDVFLDPGLTRGTHKPDRRHVAPRPDASAPNYLARRLVAGIIVLGLLAALVYFAFWG